MSHKLTCVILAGGQGKRLLPVVSGIPKPMALVSGRPFLEYLLRQVCKTDCTDVVLCIGYKAHVIKDYFGNGCKYGVKIHYSQEQELLGTAGALSLSRHLIRSDPFLVMNGDSYCAVDFDRLVGQHQACNAVATIVTTSVENQFRYGSVMIGPQDVIVRFVEKAEANGSRYINGGIYVLTQAVLDLIPSGKSCSIEKDVFPSLVGHGLYAFKTSGVFIDIGTPLDLQRAQTILKDHFSYL